MSESRQRTVVNGVLMRTSPSQVVMADPSQYGGCLRRWHFNKVGGRPEPRTAQKEAGVRAHKELEDYLRSGVKALGPLALAAARYAPPPGPDLQVEHAIQLEVAGVPMHGYVDLVHRRGTSLRDDGDVDHDPADTVAIEDWKFTGSTRRFKDVTNRTVAEAVPMICYGRWAVEQHCAPFVRLGHVYGLFGQGRPKARRCSVLVRAEDIDRRMVPVAAVVRRMRDAAGEPDSNKVDANEDACHAYGQPCPHRDVCAVGRQRSLTNIFGESGARSVLDALASPAAPSRLDALCGNVNREDTMSVFEKLTPTALGAAAPAAPAPTQAPAATLDMAAQIQAQMAALQAQEAAAKAARAAQAPAARPGVPAGFEANVDAVIAAGCGFPALTGGAAAAYAALRGIEAPATGFPATDGPDGARFNVGKLTARTAQELAQLAKELGALGLAPAAPAPAVVNAAPAAPPPAPPVAEDAPVPTLPPDAPESKPELASAPPTAPAAPAAEAPAKRRPGRPKKDGTGQMTPHPAAELALSAHLAARADEPLVDQVFDKMVNGQSFGEALVNTATEQVARETTPGVSTSTLRIYVDCFPIGHAVRTIDSYVAHVAEVLRDKYGQGAADIRCAPKDSVLAFGGWKGALAAVIREAPPEPGVYVLLTGRSELNVVAAEALERFIVATGVRS